MDLVEFVDDVPTDDAGLFKTVEVFRGTFFLSTSVEVKTKNVGGGRADGEIIDSSTSLPSIFTPRHCLAVSAICFDKSDLA